MIVLQLESGEAEALAEELMRSATCGWPSLVAYDPIDRALKVKKGVWSPPFGTVVADD